MLRHENILGRFSCAFVLFFKLPRRGNAFGERNLPCWCGNFFKIWFEGYQNSNLGEGGVAIRSTATRIKQWVKCALAQDEQLSVCAVFSHYFLLI